MGQEAEKQERLQQFEGYTVDDRDDGARRPAAVFMHCLPAYRGLEVAADVIDGPQSVVFQQGHNRLHAARGALAFLLGRAAPRSTNDQGEQGATQTTISRLIGEHEVTSQPQLIELLAEHGIEATQATVSRDLDDIGAVKVRVPSGNTVYAIPEFAPDRLAPLDQLRRVMGEWVAEVACSGNIVMLRTPPGCAHVVASALDRSRVDGSARHRRRRRHADVRGRIDRSAARSPATSATSQDWTDMTDSSIPIGPDGKTLWHGRFAGGPAEALMATRSACRSTARCGATTSPARGPRPRARSRRPADRRRARLRPRRARPGRRRDGSDTFVFVESDEDIHTAVERRVTELAGPAGGKLHTGP
jgi:transcriptional regulator of arginine metabolism